MDARQVRGRQHTSGQYCSKAGDSRRTNVPTACTSFALMISPYAQHCSSAVGDDAEHFCLADLILKGGRAEVARGEWEVAAP